MHLLATLSVAPTGDVSCCMSPLSLLMCLLHFFPNKFEQKHHMLLRVVGILMHSGLSSLVSSGSGSGQFMAFSLTGHSPWPSGTKTLQKHSQCSSKCNYQPWLSKQCKWLLGAQRKQAVVVFLAYSESGSLPSSVLFIFLVSFFMDVAVHRCNTVAFAFACSDPM